MGNCVLWFFFCFLFHYSQSDLKCNQQRINNSKAFTDLRSENIYKTLVLFFLYCYPLLKFVFFFKLKIPANWFHGVKSWFNWIKLYFSMNISSFCYGNFCWKCFLYIFFCVCLLMMKRKNRKIFSKVYCTKEERRKNFPFFFVREFLLGTVTSLSEMTLNEKWES